MGSKGDNQTPGIASPPEGANQQGATGGIALQLVSPTGGQTAPPSGQGLQGGATVSVTTFQVNAANVSPAITEVGVSYRWQHWGELAEIYKFC
jgi:hypothetical protein